MPKLTDFIRDAEQGDVSQWSDDSLRNMCTDDLTTAKVAGKLPPQRQVALLSSLDLGDILKGRSNFSLIFDAVSPEAKVHLLCNTNNTPNEVVDFIESIRRSELDKIDKTTLNNFIEDNRLINNSNAVILSSIENDPAGFLQNKYAIDKFKVNPPRLSMFESIFSMFYNQKIDRIKQQLHAVNTLDNFLSGGDVSFDEVSAITGTLRQTSNLFNTESIEKLVDAVQQNLKDNSSTEDEGYSSSGSDLSG